MYNDISRSTTGSQSKIHVSVNIFLETVLAQFKSDMVSITMIGLVGVAVVAVRVRPQQAERGTILNCSCLAAARSGFRFGRIWI